MSIMKITRGIPASGKSTYAREWVTNGTNRIEINRDNIRSMMNMPPHGNYEQEKEVTTIHRAMMNAAIANQQDMVISDTNLRAKHVKEIIAIGIRAGYDIEIVNFPIDYNEAIKRDRHRHDSVGEEVIRNMYKRFPSTRWPNGHTMIQEVRNRINQVSTHTPYINDPANPKALLVDIDGTIAHNDDQRSYYDYSEAVKNDRPDHAVIAAVQLAHRAGYKIIIMSGREERCKEFSIEWMNEHNVPFTEVHFRGNNDQRPDWIIKDELVRKYVQDYFYVMWCYDDRNQVVDHHRAMGYQVFQVAPGNF